MRILRGTELRGKVTRVPGADVSNAPANVIIQKVPPVVVPTYFTEERDPTPFDDVDDGAVIHSQWINIITPSVWTCASNTAGQAVWVFLSAAPVTPGMSAGTLWMYQASTKATSGYPGDGSILWDNTTQTSATSLLFAHLTQDGLDIDLLLSGIVNGNTLFVQDRNNSSNYQKWTVSGSPTNTNPGTSTSYWTVPVTFVSSGGIGTTGFPNNHRLFVAKIS